MTDDYVIDVRQIGEYPLKGAADPGDFILMQTGGLGGPYVVTTAYGVAQALGGPDGQIGIGLPLPADAVGTGVLASHLLTGLGCTQGWNWYRNALGTASLFESGTAGIMCYDGAFFELRVSDPGSAGQPIVNSNAILQIDTTGYMAVGNTVVVTRDPVAALEVATKQYVDAADQALSDAINTLAATSVRSFNGRVGAVVLTLTDVTGAGGAPLFSPGFVGAPTAPTPNANDNSTALATTAFVATAIANTLASNNLVRSFNGRGGDVVLTLSDVTGVGGAPIGSPAFTGSPTSPTPPITAINGEVATAAFVRAIADLLQDSLQAEIARIVRVAPSPPPLPGQGDLWWDSSDTPHGGQLYIWYVDGGIGQWVIANESVGPPGPPGKGIDPFESRTASFTAEDLKTYLVTAAAPLTVTLPVSPTGGDWVQLIDAGKNWSLQNVTVNAGPHNIEGSITPLTLDVAGSVVLLAYVGGAAGWRAYTL